VAEAATRRAEDQNFAAAEGDRSTATWNHSRESAPRASEVENAASFPRASKLRDQAKVLSDRMKARQIQGAGDSFKSSSAIWTRPWRRWARPPTS